MFFPLKLKSPLGRSYNVALDDILPTKAALKKLGYDNTRNQEISPYPDDAMFTGIEKFQRDSGLRADGIMKPGGQTLKSMNATLDMRSATEAAKRPDTDGRQQTAQLAIPVIVYKVAEFLGMSVMAAWAWWQTLSDRQKQAIIHKIEGTSENDSQADEKEDCEYLHYKVDMPTCDAVRRRRGKWAGARCRATAMERYAACLKGAPKEHWPPLDTWNN